MQKSEWKTEKMKTLDEVIKAYEICTQEQNCSYCPYVETDINGKWACSLCGDCTRDALEYLKYLKAYRDDKDYLTALRAYRTEQQANPPLTWEELKTMKGKPVWIEDNIDEPEDITKYWAIMWRIEKAEGDEYALLSDLYYEKSQYGKQWTAYRKER